MEYWFLRNIINLSVFCQDEFRHYPPLQFPITHYSIIPSFQHSNWGEAPKFIHSRVFCQELGRGVALSSPKDQGRTGKVSPDGLSGSTGSKSFDGPLRGFWQRTVKEKPPKIQNHS